MTMGKGAQIIPLEADAMKNIEMGFIARRFCVLPRGGWKQPVNLMTHYQGIVWRENVGNFTIGKRFVRSGGFIGKADWCGIIKGGRWLFFEAKKDPKTNLSDMQRCMANWMKAYGAVIARVWDYQSTIDALKGFGL